MTGDPWYRAGKNRTCNEQQSGGLVETDVSWSLEYIGHVCTRKTRGTMWVDLESKEACAVHLIYTSWPAAKVLLSSNSRLVAWIELLLSSEKC